MSETLLKLEDGMKKCVFVLFCIFNADETKVPRVAVNNKLLSFAGKMQVQELTSEGKGRHLLSSLLQAEQI
jgi:hypothetical protein